MDYKRHPYIEDDSRIVKIQDPIGSRKWDGASYFLHFDEQGTPAFISRRQGVKGDFPDRTVKLPHLSTPLPAYANQTFHVELVHTGHDMSKDAIESHPVVSGILNSLPPRALDTQQKTGPVRAVLLDVLHPRLPTYGEKIEYMQKLEQDYGKPSLLFTPEWVEGQEAITNLAHKTKQNEAEGVIITSKTAPETNNPRLKLKHKGTWNLKVVAINQEVDINGNLKNSMGALVVADKTGRIVAAVGTGFSRELREEIWAHKDRWMNRMIQVKAMNPTAHKLRAPVYNGLPDGAWDIV
jgi:hypothetical protein